MRKAGKPMKPKEVAEAAGMDTEEVSKLITALKKEGKMTSPKRCFYAPAE
ncbi:transcriptional regulator [Thermodesulfovibrionales bacterium]|nr:transcriptional regulator [Thermodesulfovibrionales bacterium]